MTFIDQLLHLFTYHGQGAYFGESVSETEHALQAAHLARQQGAPDCLVAAALLHDVGHLLHHWGEDFTARGIDDQHESAGAAWLEAYFPPEVVQPVRLHVAAKRYLCAVQPDYYQGLSETSRRSLALQGGPMSPAEQAAFEQDPHWRDALQLRLWDDAAKIPGLDVPGLQTYRPLLTSLLRNSP
jgi:phosphonate degradation associated HDIG domain protein